MRTRERESGVRVIEVQGPGADAAVATEAGQRRRELLDAANRAIERALTDDSETFVRESRQTGAQ